MPRESWSQEGALEVVGEMKGIGKVEEVGEEKRSKDEAGEAGQEKGKGV